MTSFEKSRMSSYEPPPAPQLAPPKPEAPRVVEVAKPPVGAEPGYDRNRVPSIIPSVRTAAPKADHAGEDETVVISSATTNRPQGREFVPAPLVPQPVSESLGPGEISLTPGLKNIVRRFENKLALNAEVIRGGPVRLDDTVELL